jgi:hypothetical protein
LLTTKGEFDLPGLGPVDDSDILQFFPTSLGETTAGSFSLFFDGSDVGLSSGSEGIDAIGVAPDGRLVVSTEGSFSAGGVSGEDEDLLVFSATSFGAETSGSFELYFDGSDVELDVEDIEGSWIDPLSNDIYLTVTNAFAVTGAAGDGSDIFTCIPGTLGDSTSCSYSLFWDGSAHGFDGFNTDGISLGSEASLSKTIYVSSSSGGNAGGVAFRDEDILAHDPGNGTWAMVFDGSDVGLRKDVNGFLMLDDGSILLTFNVAFSAPGLGTVDDSDILQFFPTSLGSTTAGTTSFYFDGSDVGLSTGGEDIDAIGVAPDGRLVISTAGSFSVSGVSGKDEDLLVFNATSFGADTGGSFELYFDGSDVELKPEDVGGTWIDPVTNEIYLTTNNDFSVTGATGDRSDIFTCTPGTLGDSTSCSYSFFWDGSANGFGGERLDGFSLGGAGLPSLP